MKRRGMTARGVMILACFLVLVVGGGHAQADLITVRQLSTVGLSDFQQVKLFETCLDFDELRKGVADNPSIEIIAEIDLIDIPDLGIRGTRGKWRLGPIEFMSDFGRVCISNLDVKIDITDRDGDGLLVDRSGLDAKLNAIKDAVPVIPETVELEKSDMDEDGGREAREIVDRIRESSGLLPEFTIRFTYTVRRSNNLEVLDSKTVSWVNSNPEPIRVLRPQGAQLRPTLRFRLPNVPSDVGYLENEFWIEDANGRNLWQGHVDGGTVKVRYTASDYGRLISHPYPSTAPSLNPGEDYTIVSKLRDPYGVEVDPDRLVGVRHDPDGERQVYSVVVDRIRLVSPPDIVTPSSAPTVFEWEDPNSAEVRRSVSRYRLNLGGISGQSFLVSGTRFQLPYPLAQNRWYTWSVEAIDKFGQPIPGTASEQRSIRGTGFQPSPSPSGPNAAGAQQMAERMSNLGIVRGVNPIESLPSRYDQLYTSAIERGLISADAANIGDITLPEVASLLAEDLGIDAGSFDSLVEAYLATQEGAFRPGTSGPERLTEMLVIEVLIAVHELGEAEVVEIAGTGSSFTGVIWSAVEEYRVAQGKSTRLVYQDLTLPDDLGGTGPKSATAEDKFQRLVGKGILDPVGDSGGTGLEGEVTREDAEAAKRRLMDLAASLAQDTSRALESFNGDSNPYYDGYIKQVQEGGTDPNSPAEGMRMVARLIEQAMAPTDVEPPPDFQIAPVERESPFAVLNRTVLVERAFAATAVIQSDRYAAQARALGFVSNILPGGRLTIDSQEFTRESPDGDWRVLHEGERIVASGPPGGVALVSFQSAGRGTIPLPPGTYVVTNECIQTVGGSCL